MLQRLKMVLAALTRISNGFKWLAVYMSLVGLITFPLFIHEEAIQTTMFGTWQAGPADRWTSFWTERISWKISIPA